MDDAVTAPPPLYPMDPVPPICGEPPPPPPPPHPPSPPGLDALPPEPYHPHYAVERSNTELPSDVASTVVKLIPPAPTVTV